MATALDQEKMIDLFLSLDANSDDAVDKAELLAACEQKKFKSEDVEEWLSKYDLNHDGKITLDEFCSGLGLDNNEMKVEEDERDYTASKKIPTLPKDIKIIDGNISLAKQVAITEKYLELRAEQPFNADGINHALYKLKRFLDDCYSPSWQIALTYGKCWSAYAHDPLLSLLFEHEKFVCLIWRTQLM